MTFEEVSNDGVDFQLHEESEKRLIVIFDKKSDDNVVLTRKFMLERVMVPLYRHCVEQDVEYKLDCFFKETVNNILLHEGEAGGMSYGP